MKSPVRELVDRRRAELMNRLAELEHLRGQGEGASTRSLELSLPSAQHVVLGAHLTAPEVSARAPEVVKISLDDLEERARSKTLEGLAPCQIPRQPFPEGPELGDLRALGRLGHGRDPL
jgi:hypothetical protein